MDQVGIDSGIRGELFNGYKLVFLFAQLFFYLLK